MREFLEFMMQPHGISALSAYMSILIAILVGTYARIWRDISLFTLFIYCILAFLFSLIEIYVLWVLEGNTIIVQNLWGIVSLLSLSLYFYLLLRSHRKLVFGISAVLFVLSAGYTFWYLSRDEFAGLMWSAENSALILFTILGYHKLFVEEEAPDILSSPEFWVLSGMLMYLTGSLFSFLLSDGIITNDRTAIMGMWHFHNFFNLLRYVFFAIGFWKFSRSGRGLRLKAV